MREKVVMDKRYEYPTTDSLIFLALLLRQAWIQEPGISTPVLSKRALGREGETSARCLVEWIQPANELASVG